MIPKVSQVLVRRRSNVIITHSAHHHQQLNIFSTAGKGGLISSSQQQKASKSIAFNNNNNNFSTTIESSLSNFLPQFSSTSTTAGGNNGTIHFNGKQTKNYSTSSTTSKTSNISAPVSSNRNQQTILSYIETTKKKRIEEKKREMTRDILDTFSEDPITSKFLTNIISNKLFSYSTPKKLKDAFQYLLIRKSRKIILSPKFDNLPEETQYSIMCKTLSEDLLPFIQECISEGNYDFLKRDVILQSLFLPTRSMRFISRDVALYLLENDVYQKLNIQRSIVEDAILAYYRVTENLEGFTTFVTENQLSMSIVRYGMFIELIHKNGDSKSLTTVFESMLNDLLAREEQAELNLTPKEWDIISKSLSLATNHYQLLGELGKAEELFSLSIHSQNLYQSKPSNFNTTTTTTGRNISFLKSHTYSSLTGFNTLIKAYLNSGLVDQSYKLIEVAFTELAYLASNKMINAPLVKQSKQFISIINPLLNMLILRGNLQEADKLVASIFDKSSPLQRSYSRAMNSLFSTNSGDYTINADRVTFLILIRRHSIDGNIGEIVNILRNMHVFGTSPSNDILQSAIVSLAFNGQAAGIEALLQFFVSEFDYKLTDYAAYAIMKCYVQTGNIQKAENVLQEYHKIGKPIIGMYNVVIGSNLTQLHNYEAACKHFFNAIQEPGLAFAINQHTFAPFIHFFTIASDDASLKCINTLQTFVEKNPKETAFSKYSQILNTIYQDISRGRKGENGMSVQSVVEQSIQKTKSLLSQAKGEIHKEMQKHK